MGSLNCLYMIFLNEIRSAQFLVNRPVSELVTGKFANKLCTKR